MKGGVLFVMAPSSQESEPPTNPGRFTLPCPDGRGMPHHRRKVTLAPRLHLEHAEATLGIVEGDTLDGARQRLLGRAALELSRSDHLVHVPARAAIPALLLLYTAALVL